jgi:hypothetical protein
MIRSNRHEPTRQARRARDEAVAAWDHLRAAATEGARRVGDSSRRSSETAKERANNAAMALRGQTPRSAVRRWLGAGLAVGAMIGAVGAAVLGRRRNHDSPQSMTGHDDGVRDKANMAMDTVRERATTAAHRAAIATRDTAAKLSEATKPRPQGNGAQSRVGTESSR